MATTFTKFGKDIYTADFLCKRAYIQNYIIGKPTSEKLFRLYFSKVWVNSYRLNPNSNVESPYLANGNYFHEVRKRHIYCRFSLQKGLHTKLHHRQTDKRKTFPIIFF